MIKIHKYGKQHFEDQLDQQESDKKKFEVDIKYFTEWFSQGEKRIRDKFEYFYGPYTHDKEMIENIKKRRAAYMSRSQKRTSEALTDVRLAASFGGRGGRAALPSKKPGSHPVAPP